MNLTDEQWQAVREAGLRAGATKNSVKKWPKRETVPWQYRRKVAAHVKAHAVPLPADFLAMLEGA